MTQIEIDRLERLIAKYELALEGGPYGGNTTTISRTRRRLETLLVGYRKEVLAALKACQTKTDLTMVVSVRDGGHA